MSVRFARMAVVAALLLGVPAGPALAEQAPQASSARRVRVTGIVRDDSNNITLPGLPVEVVGTGQTVYTDVDGRYVLDLPPGSYQLKVSMEGYQERVITVDVVAGSRPVDADVNLKMSGFTDTVVVQGDAPVDAVTSSAEVMIAERKNAPTISDNLGAQDMKKNADSDAAGAMSRVTGLSVVDNQYVYVRGLGERYSNTTLSGATLPTTEPDKKVVPMDMFPAGLLDNVSVIKSYSVDKSAEFAGGLVQVTPIKFPSRPVISFGYGFSGNTITTGKSIPLSPLGSRDWLGYDNGARAIPSSFPANKIVRQGIYTPDVGYTPTQIAEFGRDLENAWSPATADGCAGPELVGGVRQPLRQVRRGGEHDPVVPRAVHRRAARLLPYRRRRRARGRQRLRHAVRHAARPARRRGQPVVPVHAEQPHLARELLQPLWPRRGPLLRRAEHREQLLLPELPAPVHRRGSAVELAHRRALLPELEQQPVRVARQSRPGRP